MHPSLRILFFLLLFCTGSLRLSAQDLHYSLIDFMPTWLNPSLTGAYEGTARIGGLYRDQNIGGLSERGYQTPGFYLDAPLLMLGKKAWLGVGGLIINDQVGFARLQHFHGMASASYHRILSQNRKGQRTVLSFGLNGGIINRGLDLSRQEIILAEEQETNIGGGGLGIGAGLDRTRIDNNSAVSFGLGANLARTIDETRNFRVGISARQIFEVANQGLNTPVRPMSLSLQGAYRQLLNQQYLIEPQAFFQTSGGGFLAAQVQGMGGMLMGSKKDRILKAGLGVRLPARFVYPMVGYEVKDLRIAAAFDISANQLQSNAEGFQRGFELAFQYIIKYYKKPNVERIILCPQI